MAATARDHVQDNIIRQLLYADTTAQQPPLKSGGLLSAIDLDQLSAATAIKSVQEVPGGTVTFVFEKTINKSLHDEE